MENNSRRKGQGGSINLPGILITALFVLMEGWFFYRLLRLKMVPSKYMWPIGVGLVLLAALVAFLCWNTKKKGLFVAGTILAILLSCGMIFGSGVVDKIRSTAEEWVTPSTDAYQTVQMGIYVLKGGPIQHLEDLDGKTIGIMKSVDLDEARQVLDEISRKLNSPLEVVPFTGFVEVARALYDGEIHAAVLDENFITVLANMDGFEDVAQRIHKVTEYRAERPTQPTSTPAKEPASSTAADTTEASDPTHGTRKWTIVKHRTRPSRESDPTGVKPAETQESWTETQPPSTTPYPEGPIGTDPPPTQAPTAGGIYVPAGQEGRIFTVYISGLDTRGGGLASRGNSDVNILASVNMNTKQILLINTPRDYYISFPTVGGTDKLTHAGYYGVDASMAALRNLYGVSPQYYAQIGFDGVKALVDAVGGVTVYSAYSFDSGRYSFSAGNNALNGAQALAFARHRYTLPGGDLTRGQNQMALIRAIMAKLTSSAAISNFGQVLDSVGGLMRTSMPYDTIASVSQSVLSGGWNIASYGVSGSGGMTYSFSIGQTAYVMYPNYGTVSHAQSLIRRMYNGEWVSP